MLTPKKDKKSHLCAYSIDDRKETVLGDANNYQITFDGKKMLLKINRRRSGLPEESPGPRDFSNPHCA